MTEQDVTAEKKILPADEFELDLVDICRALWSRKWMIIGVGFASTIAAAIIALLLPNIYRAEALLASNQNDGGAGLSALASQYGGLATLAGISIPNSPSDNTDIGLEILKSRRFLSEFIERHQVLVPLIAAYDWSMESGEVKIDSDIYDSATGRWVRQVRAPRKQTPSMQEAYDEFRDILTVSQDKSTGFVTIAVEYYSPDLAKQWVDWLVEDINAEVMRQDVAEAERAIEYLNKQVESTSMADLRQAFFSLIEEQTKTIMLAKVSNEYLLKTLDPAVAPEKRTKPNRVLIVIMGALLGGFLGATVVFISNLFGTNQKA